MELMNASACSDSICPSHSVDNKYFISNIFRQDDRQDYSEEAFHLVYLWRGDCWAARVSLQRKLTCQKYENDRGLISQSHSMAMDSVINLISRAVDGHINLSITSHLYRRDVRCWVVHTHIRGEGKVDPIGQDNPSPSGGEDEVSRGKWV